MSAEIGSLEAYVNGELKNAVTYADSVVSEERSLAYRYFQGKPYGNEVDGRSRVVTRDVLETVLWTMPPLMRIFMGGDNVCEVEPEGEEDEELAKQQTEAVNHVFQKQNEGFQIFHDMFMDALIQKNGVVKVYWDERKSKEKADYKGLTGEQVAMLEADGWSVVKAESYPDPMADMQGMGPEELMQAQMQGFTLPMLYDVKLEREKDESQVRIYNVPPEEFLVSRRVSCISEEEGGVFHRRLVTVGDLIAEGYRREDVEGLSSSHEDAENFLESYERYEDEGVYENYDNNDPMARKVWVTDCYVRTDMDGDGLLELRKATLAGGSDGNGVLLHHPDDDEAAPVVEIIPFASVCPIPLPHKYHGLSLAEVVMDLQLIHSAVLRGMLDSAYLANDPRHLVRGKVNLEQLMVSRPGGIVQAGADGMVEPLTTQFTGGQMFPIIEMLDRKRQSRSGVSKYGVGLEANKLANESATSAIQQSEAQNERVELMARIFAETGVKRMFRLILKALSDHSERPLALKIRGKFVETNPREWKEQTNIRVRVGLGTGNRDRKAAGLQQFAQLLTMMKQDPALAPMIGPDKVYNFAEDVADALALGDIERYMSDPKELPPQQPQPNPEAIKAQAEMQAKAQEAQAKMQISQQEAQMRAETDRMKAENELVVAREKAASELQALEQKFQMEIALKRDEMEMNHQLERDRMASEFAFKREELGLEAQLEALKMEAGSRDGQGNINTSD